MANRLFNQFQGTLQKGVVTLFAKLTFDSSGNATVVTSEVINASSNPVTINPSSGFVGEVVAPDGANFTLKLQDPYVRLLMASVVEVVAGTASVAGVVVVADDVKEQLSPSVTVAFGNAAPTDTTVLLSLTLSNTTAL